MFKVDCKTDDDVVDLKKLMAYGPNVYSQIPYKYNGDKTFYFKEEKDYKAMSKAYKDLRKTDVKEDLVSDNLASAVAQTMNQGTLDFKKKGVGTGMNSKTASSVSKTTKPIAPMAAQAQDKLKAQFSKTIARDPTLKQQITTTMKQAGVDPTKLGESERALYSIAIQQIQMAQKQRIAEDVAVKNIATRTTIYKSTIKKLWEAILLESTEELKRNIIELLVTFETQGVTNIPYDKFIKSLEKSSGMYNIEQSFLTGLIADMDPVQEVDVANNKIVLKTHEDEPAGGVESGKEQKDLNKEKVKKTAANQAQKSMSDNKPFAKL